VRKDGCGRVRAGALELRGERKSDGSGRLRQMSSGSQRCCDLGGSGRGDGGEKGAGGGMRGVGS